MEIEAYRNLIIQQDDEQKLVDFCRKYVLHGTPHVFKGREDDYYEFRKRISNNFGIDFYEIYITGSAKLGFSPYKFTGFDYDSDIDVALVSETLFGSIMERIAMFQMRFRQARDVIREPELKMYHQFLEYVAIGWIRPDKLPVSFQMRALKNEWFGFFNRISYENSEAGNYKISGGIFKSYGHLERYIVSGLKNTQAGIKGAI